MEHSQGFPYIIAGVEYHKEEASQQNDVQARIQE